MTVFQMLSEASPINEFGFHYCVSDGDLTIMSPDGASVTVVEASDLLATINILLAHTPDRDAALADLVEHVKISQEIIESLD